MAGPDTLNGAQLLVQIGDGETPTEAFAHDCLINAERGIVFSVDTNEEVVPDCTNPEDPAWKIVTKDGLSGQITGSGKAHTTTLKSVWWDWFTGKDPKNCRVKLNGVTLAKGGGHWAGAFHCTNLELTGDGKALATASVTLMSTGPLTWVPASA